MAPKGKVGASLSGKHHTWEGFTIKSNISACSCLKWMALFFLFLFLLMEPSGTLTYKARVHAMDFQPSGLLKRQATVNLLKF